MSEKTNKILISLVSIVVTGLLVSGYFLQFHQAGTSNGLISMDKAAQKAMDYINQRVLSGGIQASLLDTSEEDNIYKIRIKVQGQEYDSYVTKDGRYLFPDGFDMDEEVPETQTPEEQVSASQEIPKRETPEVKLFVMSYCPYGLQAQKMFLPVYELLQDKAQMGIYFVDYIMHEKKEIDENLNQYCIQKEKSDKYDEYLSCFVQEGKTADCMNEAGVDPNSIQSCIDSADQEYSIYSQYEDESTWLNGTFPPFDVHSDLNKEYGVRGSPTLVINGAVVASSQSGCPTGGQECVVVSGLSRSPESFKNVVCEAFENPPDECSQTLSDTPFQPGFGMEEGSNTGGAACGS